MGGSSWRGPGQDLWLAKKLMLVIKRATDPIHLRQKGFWTTVYAEYFDKWGRPEPTEDHLAAANGNEPAAQKAAVKERQDVSNRAFTRRSSY